jgi:hypothetical protein
LNCSKVVIKCKFAAKIRFLHGFKKFLQTLSTNNHKPTTFFGANCPFVFGIAIPAFGYISPLRCEDTASIGAEGLFIFLLCHCERNAVKRGNLWKQQKNKMRLLCHWFKGLNTNKHNIYHLFQL